MRPPSATPSAESRQWYRPDRVRVLPEPGRLQVNALINDVRHRRGRVTAGDDRLEARAYAMKRYVWRLAERERSGQFACSIAQLTVGLAPMVGWPAPPRGGLEREQWVQAHEKSVRRWLDWLQAAGVLTYEGEYDNRGQLWRTLIRLAPAPAPPADELDVARVRLRRFKYRRQRAHQGRLRRRRRLRSRGPLKAPEAVLEASSRPQRRTRRSLARQRAFCVHRERRDRLAGARVGQPKDVTHPFGAPPSVEYQQQQNAGPAAADPAPTAHRSAASAATTGARARSPNQLEDARPSGTAGHRERGDRRGRDSQEAVLDVRAVRDEFNRLCFLERLRRLEDPAALATQPRLQVSTQGERERISPHLACRSRRGLGTQFVQEAWQQAVAIVSGRQQADQTHEQREAWTTQSGEAAASGELHDPRLIAASLERMTSRRANAAWSRRRAAEDARQAGLRLLTEPAGRFPGLGRLRAAWVLFHHGLEIRDGHQDAAELSGAELLGDHGSRGAAGPVNPDQRERVAAAIARYEAHRGHRPPGWPAGGAAAMCVLASQQIARDFQGDVIRLEQLADRMRAAARHANPDHVQRSRRRAERRNRPAKTRFEYRTQRGPGRLSDGPDQIGLEDRESRRRRIRDLLLLANDHPGLSPHVFTARHLAEQRHEAGHPVLGDPADYELPDGLTARAQRYQDELRELGCWELPAGWSAIERLAGVDVDELVDVTERPEDWRLR